jgi:hypothetical protein
MHLVRPEIVVRSNIWNGQTAIICATQNTLGLRDDKDASRVVKEHGGEG